MSHRFDKKMFSSVGIALILTILIIPYTGVNQAALAASIDNGFANGVYYRYSGSGTTDFNFYFYNNGFSSSNGNPEQIVLTATTSQGTGGIAYQISIFIYSSTNVQLDDEAWDLSTGTCCLFHTDTAVSGIPNSWHTIELKDFLSGGQYYIGYYLDGTRHNSWVAQSSFDSHMVPSIVLESADYSTSDWNSHTAQGYLETGSTGLNTYFYGGAWGASNAACSVSSYQSSGYYVGQGIQDPNNVGTTGHILTGYGTNNELALGDTYTSLAINDQIEKDANSGFGYNPCNTAIS